MSSVSLPKLLVLNVLLAVFTVTLGCSGGSGSDKPNAGVGLPTEAPLSCDAGDWLDGDSCRPCPAGTWSAAGATECLAEVVPNPSVTIVSACVSMDCVGHDCGSENNPYGVNQVQQAIAHASQQASQNNVVYLTPGRYVPQGCAHRVEGCEGNARLHHFSLANNVSVIGGYALQNCGEGAGDTVLSGDLNDDDDLADGTSGSDNTYHVFYHPVSSALNASATLKNVTITGGRANAVSPHDSGAGMYNFGVSPILTDVVLAWNEASKDGGGMVNIAADVMLENVTFTGNKANNGGGLLNGGCDPLLLRTTFSENVAISAGGGMFNESANTVIVQSHFLDNRAAYGGAVFNGGSAVSLVNTAMTGNSASEGGAIYNGGSEPMLVNVAISANTADQTAGGMFNAGSNSQSTNVTFTQNAAQEAGAVFNGGSTPVWNNSIVWGNTSADYVGVVQRAAYSLFGELSECTTENCPVDGDAGNQVGQAESPFAQALTPQCLGSADGLGDWAAFVSAMTLVQQALDGIAQDIDSLLLKDAYGHRLPDIRQAGGRVNIGAVHACQ